MAVALSDRDVAWVRAFIESGGTALCDSEVGRFDEELRPRPGRLGEHPRLVRFGHDLTGYPRRRCETFEPLPEMGAFRPIIDGVLPPAWVRIEPAQPGRFELTTFGRGPERILAVQRNDARLSTGQPLKDNRRPAADVVLRFAEPQALTDALSEEDYGVTDTLTLTIDPIRATFLRAAPPA